MEWLGQKELELEQKSAAACPSIEASNESDSMTRRDARERIGADLELGQCWRCLACSRQPGYGDARLYVQDSACESETGYFLPHTLEAHMEALYAQQQAFERRAGAQRCYRVEIPSRGRAFALYPTKDMTRAKDPAHIADGRTGCES